MMLLKTDGQAVDNELLFLLVLVVSSSPFMEVLSLSFIANDIGVVLGFFAKLSHVGTRYDYTATMSCCNNQLPPHQC